MFYFNQPSVSPAVKSQLDTQFAFYSDLSKKMFEGVQKLNELNVQVATAVFEESLTSTKQLLSSTDRNEALSIAAGQAQPAAEKIRAYQHHVQSIFAETQASAAQTLESHMAKTVRATEAVVNEVAQKASEETAKVTQRQQEAMAKLTTPIKPNSERVSQNNGVKAA
jgi:phasin family protein